jgi:hypothetical protein
VPRVKSWFAGVAVVALGAHIIMADDYDVPRGPAMIFKEDQLRKLIVQIAVHLHDAILANVNAHLTVQPESEPSVEGNAGDHVEQFLFHKR